MPLKVCLHITNFGPGGAERQVANLARELAVRGIEVVVLHVQEDAHQENYLQGIRESGIEVINAVAPHFLKEGMRLSRQHSLFFGKIPAPLPLRMGILFLAGAFSLLKPDIVHSYLDIPNCTAGCAAVLAGVGAHLASFRNMDPQTLGDARTAELTLPLYRHLLANSCPHFEANSHAGAMHYARWLNIDLGKIGYNPNGIDPASYMALSRDPGQLRQALGIPETAPLLLTLARFDQPKSPASMLDIFARVHAARPDTRYVIAGARMTVHEEMGAMVRARGLDKSVHLLGVRNDVAPLMSIADVFLLPSRVEGFPNVIMEAMTAGLPVVASNVGGIPDLVRHGRDGFLHAADDVEGMAASALALLADAALRERFGAAGRQRILEEFSLRKLGDRVLRRYEDLLAPAPRTMS